MHEQSSTPFYCISALELSREELQFHKKKLGDYPSAIFIIVVKIESVWTGVCPFKRMTLQTTASDQNFSLLPTNPRVTAILVPRTSVLVQRCEVKSVRPPAGKVFHGGARWRWKELLGFLASSAPRNFAFDLCRTEHAEDQKDHKFHARNIFLR